MSSWGCPHDLNGQCQRVPGRSCDIGMKGCVLFGRFTFADESKNAWRDKKAERARRDSARSAGEATDRRADRDPDE
jgi:hypothetical protein